MSKIQEISWQENQDAKHWVESICSTNIVELTLVGQSGHSFASSSDWLPSSRSDNSDHQFVNFPRKVFLAILTTNDALYWAFMFGCLVSLSKNSPFFPQTFCFAFLKWSVAAVFSFLLLIPIRGFFGTKHHGEVSKIFVQVDFVAYTFPP